MTPATRLLARDLERLAGDLERDAARARAAAAALNGRRTLPAPIPAIERLRDPAYRRRRDLTALIAEAAGVPVEYIDTGAPTSREVLELKGLG